ncbi:hypothetical protein [Granulicella paludicola]|uniref:hypothetical protein n=1 Tax=Granulicella paludicola TaxID=474951 RepID=UPI0021DF8050|nr:hypothetical protein [Granulicella paludicola]
MTLLQLQARLRLCHAGTCFLCFIFLGASSLKCQSSQQTSSHANVTGRVILVDTRQPARAAKVTLIPVAVGERKSEPSIEKTTLSRLDGAFLFKNVPYGDYYLAAEVSGYVEESAVISESVRRGGGVLKTLDSLPHMHVTEAGADVQIGLQKGASFTGTVSWEDGSPASATTVEAIVVSDSRVPDFSVDPAQPGFGALLAANGTLPIAKVQTDDRGRFRLTGLPPGGYIVKATKGIPLEGEMMGSYPLQSFEDKKIRESEAPVRKLSSGEERDGLEIVLSVDGLHSVSGQVSAAGGLVHSGEVRLKDKIDGNIQPVGQIQSDGTFSIYYVPSGRYDIVVTASSQASQATRCCTYTPTDATLEQTLTVTDRDVAGLNLIAPRLIPHQ